MFQRSLPVQNWVRGALGPGSKHQKHVSLVPTQYLYRFAKNKNNPGPIVMKYYWTLGCFPTGLEVPFRMSEFLREYQAAHVPEEVDDWLRSHIKDPVETLEEAVVAFSDAMNRLPNAITGGAYRTQLPMVSSALPQLESLEKELGVQIPAICLRGVAGNASLKARALDELYEYKSCLRDVGSTPHRRIMHNLLEEARNEKGGTFEDLFLPNLGMLEQLPSGNNANANNESGSSHTEEGLSSDALATLSPTQCALATALRVDKNNSADDERAVIRLLTTFGEGAMRAKKYDAAATVLESALLFAHDDTSRSAVHNNLATACNRAGEFKAAEHNAREAVLLDHSKNAFRNLSVALAYQQREDEALSVINDALALYQGDADLKETERQIVSFASGKPTPNSLTAAAVGAASSRYYSDTNRSRVISNGVGNHFGNQFDSVAFNDKKISSLIDPTQFTQLFRRAHVAGLSYRSSTKAFERN